MNHAETTHPKVFPASSSAISKDQYIGKDAITSQPQGCVFRQKL